MENVPSMISPPQQLLVREDYFPSGGGIINHKYAEFLVMLGGRDEEEAYSFN